MDYFLEKCVGAMFQWGFNKASYILGKNTFWEIRVNKPAQTPKKNKVEVEETSTGTKKKTKKLSSNYGPTSG